MVEKYNRWTVEGFIMKPRSDGRNRKFSICVCECGNRKEVMYKDLKNGKSKSCGCLQKEKAAITGKQMKTHGMYGTRIYSIWRGMKSRCTDVNTPAYTSYGGRGIRLSVSWRTFENFFKDMGVPDTEYHTLERVDNSLGYSKDNCVWADRKTQANNRRGNTRFTIDGVTKTVAQWCDDYSQPKGRVYKRLSYGWDIIDALTVGKITTGNKHVCTGQ